MYYYTCLHVSLYTCTTTPFWLLRYVSLKIISKNWPPVTIHFQEFQEYDRIPENSKHIKDRQCTEIYWDIKSYTTEHPTLGSSPETQGSSSEMFYDIAQTTILEILFTWWFNPSMSSLSHHALQIVQCWKDPSCGIYFWKSRRFEDISNSRKRKKQNFLK